MDQMTLEMMSLYSGDPFDLYSIEDEHFSHAYEAQGSSVTGAGGRTAEVSKNGIGSGRYHKGEGNNPYQHGISGFLERVDFYKKKGVTNEKDLAILCGFVKKNGEGNTNTFRTEYQKALHEYKIDRAARAQSMLDKGMSKKAVAKELGIRDTTLNSWLNPKSLERARASSDKADLLQKLVDEKKMLDVGDGVDMELGLSSTKMKETLSILKDRGYQVFYGRVPQATNPGQKTTLTVLAAPDQKWSDVYDHPEKIDSVVDYVVREDQNGVEHIRKKWQYPASLDSSRLMIRYADDKDENGHVGIERDGTIELRRNVPDLDLRGSRYAQVRILVDDKKYLKGVAHYSDHMPDGIDVVFNTNKTRDKADIVLKNIKSDPNNPFGTLLRSDGGQYDYTDKDGKVHLGLINKTRQEGDWEDWTDSLPHQFLAKQPIALINKQLGLAIEEKKAEFEDIMKITNPTVKKSMLMDFAEQCDSDSVHMQAAKLPRQKYQVLLPGLTLGDNEVYAPNFHDGETVALVRFPNQGIFEVPILKVNNSNPQCREAYGPNPMDAIAVSKTNADRLSGADYDGDTVMVIPCNDPRFSDTKIQNQPLLEGLIGFDAKAEYGYDKVESRLEKVRKKDRHGKTIYGEDGKPVYEEKMVDHYFRNGKEFKPMTRTGLEMGNVSNLMTDMTLQFADDAEKAMVARHAQVVIDAEKHHLDWKQSEIDNHIKELKKKYQKRVDEDGSVHYGASTLLSRAKSPTAVVKPTGSPHVDPETGKLVYTEKQLEPQTYIHPRTGKVTIRTEDVHLLSTKDDAFDLVRNRNDPKEAAYANYSNMLKSMANEARKAWLATGDIEFNRQAEQKYHEESEHLLSELTVAKLNAPRERMAQLYSRGVRLALDRDNPDMTNKELDKAANRALAEGRVRFNASRHKIDISPKEWEAIQAGAINKTNLEKILQYADPDKVRQYATPRDTVKLTTGQKARIVTALNDGRSAALLAKQFNVSVSTINKLRKGGK